MTQPSVINIKIGSVDVLRQVYMPFLTGGGIFIPSTGPLPNMGQELFITIESPKLALREATLARVAWLREQDMTVPEQHRRGFGIQFCDQHQQLRGQLENLLAARLNDPAPTCTL